MNSRAAASCSLTCSRTFLQSSITNHLLVLVRAQATRPVRWANCPIEQMFSVHTVWPRRTHYCRLSHRSLARQSKHALSDDIALHLAGARFNRVAPRPQVFILPTALKGRIDRVGGQAGVGALKLKSQFNQALVYLTPMQFEQRAFR